MVAKVVKVADRQGGYFPCLRSGRTSRLERTDQKWTVLALDSTAVPMVGTFSSEGLVVEKATLSTV